MRNITRLRSLWWNLLHRDRVERALDEELRTYVHLLAAEYEAKGMSTEKARRAARIEAGGVTQVKEAARDAWIGNAAATASREFRYALRSLGRSPGFAAIAVCTLAVGIAGATSVFSVINALLLQPLPAVAEPERLVTVERVLPSGVIDPDASYPDYRDFRAQSKALAGLAAYNGTSMSLRDRAGTGRVWASYVSDNFFSVLGVRPMLGRAFGPGDVTASGANPVVVLGYDIWRRRFGSDSSVVGTTLRLNRQVFTVIGVAPAGFIGAMALHRMELWIPLTMMLESTHGLPDTVLQSRSFTWLGLVGRLAPGMTAAQAEHDLAGLASRLAGAYPADKGHGVRVFSGGGMWHDERTEASRLPFLLAGAVVLLLAIACANVACLSLVRATAKRRELATRLALGASRGSLVRHLAIEGAVLAACAAVLGIAIAQALVRVGSIVGTIAPVHADEMQLDWEVLGVSLGVTALTAILVSMLPALHVSRANVGLVIKDGSGGAVRRARGQSALVVVQVAASLVLLASAAMVFSAFQRILAVDPGFEARGLSYVSAELSEAGYDSTNSTAFFRALLDRASTDPAFSGVALASVVPPAPWAPRDWVFRRGEEPPPGTVGAGQSERGFHVYVDAVSPTFLDVLHIPVMLGRALVASDNDRRPTPVVVSRRLAEQLWPNRDAIGQFLVSPRQFGQLQVVGVAENTRHASLTGGLSPVMYLPVAQYPGIWRYLTVVARGRGHASPPLASLRKLVAAVDPSVPVVGGKTVVDNIYDEVQPPRRASAWIGAFGVVALLLAALGLYGVVAQGVLQRTRELAVRSALGATPRGLHRLIVGQGMRLAAVGVVLGAVGVAWTLRILRSFVTAIDAIDTTAALGAAVVLTAAMLAATYIPARRAGRLNPLDALRCD